MRYTFGNISVDAEARTIERHAEALHLTRKAFDLLLLLLEQRPNAATKEQIYSRLWPDTFVSESSLQTLVHEIRQAIDDPAAAQSWIRTVHGIGYGFQGTVVADRPAPPLTLKRPAAWLLGESTRVALNPGENVLGRGTEGVTEIDLPTISRRHARIILGEPMMIEDLGSKNGTWVNDKRVTEPRELTDGDVVSLGSARFAFRVARSAQSTESTEMPLGQPSSPPVQITTRRSN